MNEKLERWMFPGLAVLTTWHPAILRTNPLNSDEIKQYNQKRVPRKPSAVPAVIVIRLLG